MGERIQITIRVKSGAVEKLLQNARDSDLSLNRVAAALLESAVEAGWVVIPPDTEPVVIKNQAGPAGDAAFSQRLRMELGQAAGAVEPGDGLPAIQERTRERNG